jgi:hypothetical protein
MRDKTEFNGEHFGAEHLMIEDEGTGLPWPSLCQFGCSVVEILFCLWYSYVNQCEFDVMRSMGTFLCSVR